MSSDFDCHLYNLSRRPRTLQAVCYLQLHGECGGSPFLMGLLLAANKMAAFQEAFSESLLQQTGILDMAKQSAGNWS